MEIANRLRRALASMRQHWVRVSRDPPVVSRARKPGLRVGMVGESVARNAYQAELAARQRSRSPITFDANTLFESREEVYETRDPWWKSLKKTVAGTRKTTQKGLFLVYND